ncbi:MAG: MMPL family transporter, partial [Bdellovibrionota bacterium]
RPGLLEAARTTAGATATAAAATAVAYGVLLVASFKGFSQFGFMGAIGMLFCWVATFTLCPPLLALGERVRPFVSKANARRAEEGTFGTKYLGEFAERTPAPIIAAGVLLTLLAVLGIFRLFKEPFEYDFVRLRLRIMDSELRIWSDRHYEVFSRGRSDALVVLTDSPEQSRLAARALNQKSAEPDSTIERIWWLGSLVPEDQNEKLEVLRKIKDLVDSQPISWMSDKQRLKVEEFKATLSLDPIKLEKVPLRLVEKLQEKDGTIGRVILIYPKKEVRLSDGRELIRFANEIRKIDLEDGTTLWTSGSPVIFADMLTSVIKDGRLTTIVCYLAVTVALFASFRNLRTTAFIMLFLTYGLVLLAGAMGFLGLKVNFFNYIVIPITVGIGVDYHINVYKRYELDGKKSIRSAVVQTGGAVILCSLTTIIGYGSMLLSATPAMVSFGLMAVVGEITCLTSALLLKPAFLVVGERRRMRAVSGKAGGVA